MTVIDEVRRVPAARSQAGPKEPIPGYDAMDAAELTPRLKTLSQGRLKRVRSYEKAHQARTSVLHWISRLTADQPWANYDTQQVKEIVAVLVTADADTARQVLDYEREHRGRAGVLAAAERYRNRSSAGTRRT